MSEAATRERLEREIEALRRENAQLLSALDEVRAKLTEPAEVIRAIRQGEIDALVVEEAGEEEIYSLQRFDSVYRTVFEECFPHGVWLAKPDGTLLYVTPSFLELLHTDLQEMREKGQFFFLPLESRESVERRWAKCRETGEPWSAEYAIRLGDGSIRTIWTQGLLVPTPDGLSHWVGVNIDVSEQARIREALRLSEEQFRLQADALQESDRRKDEFLATLAHELRNPLAPIRSGLDLLGIAEDNPAIRARALSVMDRQLRQMVRLIDDLLDVSRITRNKLELRRERVDLQTVVARALETSQPVIESNGHQLDVRLPEELLWLDADATRLAQVFANLLNNAAKFTPQGGRIWLAAERQGGDVLVRVKDTGIGISAEMRPRIFDLFVQADRSLEKSQGGLGIGLTLVKRLVEMHGGSISVDSPGAGLGSEFAVRLPLVAQQARADAPPGGKPDASVRRRRILVVDDNHAGAMMLAMFLEGIGHEVHTAHDGQEALAAAERARPELILLDIGLPTLSGYEVAKRIRQQPWGAEILLAAQTGYGQEEDRQRSRDAGFDYHLVKPVEQGALLELLARLP